MRRACLALLVVPAAVALASPGMAGAFSVSAVNPPDGGHITLFENAVFVFSVHDVGGCDPGRGDAVVQILAPDERVGWSVNVLTPSPGTYATPTPLIWAGGQWKAHATCSSAPGQVNDVVANSATYTVFVDRPSSPDVSVKDSGFTPKHLTIKKGKLVRWTWDGRKRHNVTFKKVPRGARKRHSKTSVSTLYSLRLSKAGTYSYEDTAQGLKGSITVR